MIIKTGHNIITVLYFLYIYSKDILFIKINIYIYYDN